LSLNITEFTNLGQWPLEGNWACISFKDFIK